MLTFLRITPCTDFNATLNAAADAGEVEATPKLVGQSFDRSDDIGAAIRNGSWNERLRDLRKVMFSPLRKIFIDWLLEGTEYVAVKRPTAHDCDGDGDIDKDDVVTMSICISSKMNSALEKIHAARTGDHYTSDQGAQIQQVITHAAGQLGRLGRTVVELTMRPASERRTA